MEEQDTWWRFDRYEISDGTIRPLAGSELRPTEPWSDLAAAKAKRDEFPATPDGPWTPLEELLDLTRNVSRDQGRPSGISPQSETAIVSWCSANGLFGTGLLLTEHVTFEPTQADRNGPWCQRALYKSPRGFRLVATTFDDQAQAQPTGTSTISLADPHMRPRPKSLELGWAKYFPSLDVRTGSPEPITEEFKVAYSEPLAEFIDAAHLLERAVRQIAAADEIDDDVLASLNQLLADAHPYLVVGAAAKPSQHVASTSLLVTMALMVSQFLTDGWRPRQCESCSRIFFSAAYQSRYCSRRCRHKVMMRTYRQKQSKARRLDAAGWTLEQISLELDSEVETIQGWLEKPKGGSKHGNDK